MRHGDNPFHPYKIQFPYCVKFSLAGDNRNTHITIHTTSEEIAFARSKEDVLLEKELTDEFSKEGYIKHITNFVGKELSYSNIETCELTYTGTPDIVEMTDEELEVYRREIISLD